jgi:hypothetical protein
LFRIGVQQALAPSEMAVAFNMARAEALAELESRLIPIIAAW